MEGTLLLYKIIGANRAASLSQWFGDRRNSLPHFRSIYSRTRNRIVCFGQGALCPQLRSVTLQDARRVAAVVNQSQISFLRRILKLATNLLFAGARRDGQHIC